MLPPLHFMEESTDLHTKRKKKKNKVQQNGGVEQEEKERAKEKLVVETAPDLLPLFKSVVLPEITLDIYNIAGGLAWGKRT